jgi:hypothetical protein
MTQQHPIIPPPELIDQWHSSFKGDCCPVEFASASIASIAIRAAQWGADQELEACCEWLGQEGWSGESRQLRAARRPNPQGPTDEELWELYDARSGEPEDWPWIRDYARAVLALCKK